VMRMGLLRCLFRSGAGRGRRGAAKYCITNYSYPVAQDRWYWRLVKG
jgi:hypothetical protein